MSLESWFLYVGAVLLLMVIPGPSHLLMLSNSLASGFKKSTATAAGDLSANLLQMIVASLGLATALNSAPMAFELLKWGGVIYLMYLGLRMIFFNSAGLVAVKPRSISALYWQGFITSATNPKAVVFFASLFPQFIDTSQALFPQFLVLSITYLFIDGSFLCAYGKFASLFRDRIQGGNGSAINTICGGLIVAAAIALGLKSV